MIDSEASESLPQEIITEILLRLPVKSIGRSRCVSKPWRSLLSSNEFIKTHHARHTHLVQEEKLLLLFACQSLFTLSLHPDSCLPRKLETFDKKFVELVGSCNGLVLAVTKENGMCLINCLTLECAELPNSPFPSPSFSFYRFGYDSLSDDYKIVSLSYYDKNKQPDCADTSFVDIHTVKTRSWRRFGRSPYNHNDPVLASSGWVFVNGVLHWMGRKPSPKSCVIVAFSLSCEKFQEIPVPTSDRHKYVGSKLVQLEGCLGITRVRDEPLIEVWIMKTYSLAESWTKKYTIDLLDMDWTPESWTKKYTIDLLDMDCWEPVYFHKDKILICVDDRKFIWYYPDDERWDEWMVINDSLDFDFGDELETYSYSETLVSPHF